MAKKNPKAGSPEWLHSFYGREWQIVRRHPDYIAFCDKVEYAFDNDGIRILDPTSLTKQSLKEETELIKKRFGLDAIVHPESEIPDTHIIKIPLFKNEGAVTNRAREEDPDSWNKRILSLGIDIAKSNEHIRRDLFWEIEWARRLAGISRETSRAPSKLFQIWDFYAAGLRPTEIIQQLWPDEWATATNHDEKKCQNCFEELFEQYREEGLSREDAEERAYNAAFASNMTRLYQRVIDNINRMKALLDRYPSTQM